jgi:Ca2+-transporting ATPase
VSAALGDVVDAFVIAAIVLLNAVIGFVQTYRAEKALDALKKMGTAKATVFRDGASTVLDASELVPGDVVQLEAGNAVPADMRLFDAHALKVDESALTGESVPVDKRTEALADSDSPLGDRLNMAYKGTLVANGRARAVVVATGTRTELGKIADLLGTETTDTPLKKRMAAFGRKLTYLILLVSAIVFLAGWLRGEEPVQMLLTAIGLSVAAIPESLPALLTVGLAMGAARMASQKALVRHLPAVETLGSVSFICTDKTGTLTLNEMRAARLHVHRSPYWDLDHLPLHLAMALNHDVELDKGSFRGEPTEAAIVKGVLAEIGEDTYRHLVDCFPRLSELPFDADRRCMTTVHQFGDRILLLGKGAPEAIAALLESGEEAAELDRTARQWAAEGLRVLAFGYRLLDALPGHMVSDELEKEFRWAGLVGLMDPPREKVGPAIGQCRTAGIRPVMITGDHPATACAIAADIGILTGSEQVLSGAQLDRLDKAAFAAQVENTAVYARVSPEQKLRIVRALQAKGHFVAMTGDGVNDAPSLKAADIGVAMGINGTDVSKEAAEMVLLDDDFATIVKAVEEGRRIYDNIRKFVRYILTCNSAEVWIILLAPLVGMPMPLLPIQILWINLVTDGLPGIALANETPEKDLMRRPPRPPRESLFSQGLGFHILWVGLLMAGLTLGIQAWALGTGREHWQTMVFTSLSFLQMAHALAVRSERSFVFQVGFFSNPFLLASVSATLLLQLAVVYVPFLNPLFNTSPLSLIELSVCVAVAAILFHAVECEKWVKR